MVGHADSEDSTGVYQSAGNVAILLAGGCLAGRVVVAKDHACGLAVAHRLAKDLAGVYWAGVDQAARAFNRGGGGAVFHIVLTTR